MINNVHIYREVEFKDLTPGEKEDVCPVCREEFSDSRPIVAHKHPDAEGHLHPIDKKCVEMWLKDHFSCPVCREAVDATSLDPQDEPDYLSALNKVNKAEKKLLTSRRIVQSYQQSLQNAISASQQVAELTSQLAEANSNEAQAAQAYAEALTTRNLALEEMNKAHEKALSELSTFQAYQQDLKEGDRPDQQLISNLQILQADLIAKRDLYKSQLSHSQEVEKTFEEAVQKKNAIADQLHRASLHENNALALVGHQRDRYQTAAASMLAETQTYNYARANFQRAERSQMETQRRVSLAVGGVATMGSILGGNGFLEEIALTNLIPVSNEETPLRHLATGEVTQRQFLTNRIALPALAAVAISMVSPTISALIIASNAGSLIGEAASVLGLSSTDSTIAGATVSAVACFLLSR